jgi:hypothetical protein
MARFLLAVLLARASVSKRCVLRLQRIVKSRCDVSASVTKCVGHVAHGGRRRGLVMVFSQSRLLVIGKVVLNQIHMRFLERFAD